MISLTLGFGFFFYALTTFLSSAALCFFYQPVRCLIDHYRWFLSFLSIIQLVILSNASAMAPLIDFPTFLSFKKAWSNPIDSSLVSMLVYPKP